MKVRNVLAVPYKFSFVEGIKVYISNCSTFLLVIRQFHSRLGFEYNDRDNDCYIILGNSKPALSSCIEASEWSALSSIHSWLDTTLAIDTPAIIIIVLRRFSVRGRPAVKSNAQRRLAQLRRFQWCNSNIGQELGI